MCNWYPSSLLAKPISLVERCYCRSTVNSLPRGYIRELRFIHTPNCPFQVMWVWFWMPTQITALLFHHGLKKSDRFSPLLDISHHQSQRGDRPEKRVVHACVHTRPSATRFHTHAQKAFTTGPLTHPQEVESKREVDIGCSFVFNRKTIILGFVIGFVS